MQVIEGRKAEKKRFEDSADVVIIGSGASGAVLAKEMIDDGRSVILLEEGPWYTPEQKCQFSITEAMMKLFRSQGATVAAGLGDTPLISNLLGWGAGGSSVLTGGVCFRTPDSVLDGWVKDLGLDQLSPAAMEPFFDEVEADLRIELTPEAALSEGVRRYRSAAESMGMEARRVKRNITGCRGASRCNFVCPVGAKNSVDRVYLPEALEGGTKLICDALAQRLTFSGDRVTGVEGRFLAPGGKKLGRFRVRGKLVILAMGAVHTPQFMARNGVGTGSGLLGRGLTIHPGFRAYGVFPDEVKAGLGAGQGIYLPGPMEKGITLIDIPTVPGVMGATVPGIGAASREYMEKRHHIMPFGGMIHDYDEGRIINVPGREPIIEYSLGGRAKETFIDAVKLLGRIYFEAGVEEVLISIPPYKRLRSMDDVEQMDAKQVQWKHAESASFHPLGTVRMGTSATDSIVDPSGRVWEHPNLFVVDGGIVPTHLGVNAQVTIMALALKLARGIRGRAGELFG